MPVLRTLKTYRCRSGKRFIRLYRAWRNMRDRVAGVIRSGTGEALWRGLEIAPEWDDFMAFRAWALAHGYSKHRCSLDRRRTTEGYNDHNCRWLTVKQNSERAFNPDPYDMDSKRIYGDGDECPF